MRYLFTISVTFLVILSSCSLINSESNKEIKELTVKVDSLSAKVVELTKQNKMQEDEISWIESEIVDVTKAKPTKTASTDNVTAVVAKPITKPAAATPVTKTPEKTVQDKQCQAITNSGKRCSRPAIEGSKYCLQHKEIYEPDIPQKK
jgi:hypothetical protein